MIRATIGLDKSKVLGRRVVYGVPLHVKEIVGVTPGARVRLRFRHNEAAKAFVMHGGITAAHHIEWHPEWNYWKLHAPIAVNLAK